MATEEHIFPPFVSLLKRQSPPTTLFAAILDFRNLFAAAEFHEHDHSRLEMRVSNGHRQRKIGGDPHYGRTTALKKPSEIFNDLEVVRLF
jgi:hypothetical protein